MPGPNDLWLIFSHDRNWSLTLLPVVPFIHYSVILSVMGTLKWNFSKLTWLCSAGIRKYSCERKKKKSWVLHTPLGKDLVESIFLTVYVGSHKPLRRIFMWNPSQRRKKTVSEHGLIWLKLEGVRPTDMYPAVNYSLLFFFM